MAVAHPAPRRVLLDRQLPQVLQAAQDIDLTDVDLVRADMTLRTPDDVPDGWSWRASITIDGQVYARILGWPGRTRAIPDIAANVSKLTGVHEVAIRLDLIEA